MYSEPEREGLKVEHCAPGVDGMREAHASQDP